MFGESDSESPRVGSPWDSFISPSPATVTELDTNARLNEGLPKLVPEVEYGNVEYKLKLINPSPERFLRLVTQMKWRLLEGGGQAYYELGVADSGHLVGLPRKGLEQSLETLEMMAGEIGASVIIVKEIEVPAALVGRGMNGALGIPRRTPMPALTAGELDPTMTAEAETSTTEDDDDYLLAGLELGFESLATDSTNPITYCHPHSANTRSHPERPTLQSSPALGPTPDSDPDLFNSDFEIEIASVYKPRPHRARPVTAPQTKYTKRGSVPKVKKPPNTRFEMSPADRAKERRIKRDTLRDTRATAPSMPDTGLAEIMPWDGTKPAFDLGKLNLGLESIHLKPPSSISVPSGPEEHDGERDLDENTIIIDTPEPRLIVEALVVRKLALEEAYLDFGGFALEV